MQLKEIVQRFLEQWLPDANWARLEEIFTEDVTYVDANNLTTFGRKEVLQLLRKGNKLARLIWKAETIPPNLVMNSVQEDNQVFVEWEARGVFNNGVEATVPGSTLVRFQDDLVVYYRDYVNFALFVQWAQQYPELFQSLAEAENDY
ncbi:MAG: nuclear transport factor 2 family protein [Deltaproteobacteria bacterium]|nr:nuclear transport factor 2 family protein [Deltaproteobacteria bacterium]